jgi:hypothetical protein
MDGWMNVEKRVELLGVVLELSSFFLPFAKKNVRRRDSQSLLISLSISLSSILSYPIRPFVHPSICPSVHPSIHPS